MRHFLSLATWILAAIFVFLCASKICFAQVWVKGYTRKNGTYVMLTTLRASTYCFSVQKQRLHFEIID